MTINYSNGTINNIMTSYSDISIVNVVITIVGNTINFGNTSIISIIPHIRIAISVTMYAKAVMNITMTSTIICIITTIDNMVVTVDNTINHTVICISIINTISIDTINDKLISAHDVVIDLIITINVLRLLSDMNNNITNICISTNIIISSIVSNSMHISNTDCK